MPKTPIDEPQMALGAILTPKTGKSAPTAARPVSEQSAHFYSQDGKPLYEVQKKDGSGPRPFTLADARKMDPKPLPSVTTILKVLHKEALVQWQIEQAVLATMTTPRFEVETDDEFVYRVLHTERQQDQEGNKARDRGTAIHDAMEKLFLGVGNMLDKEIVPWVTPAFDAIRLRGRYISSETVLVGPGYAGRTDLIQQCEDDVWLWDWKSAKTLPTKGAWLEHRLQLAAYAEAYNLALSDVRTGNVYISTVNCGQFVICEHEPWAPAYEAFRHLLNYWHFANNYSLNLPA